MYPFMVAPASSLLGMSRSSVAKAYLISLGVRGRFFKAPGVFLSLAKPVSFFLQKERNGGKQ